MSHSSTTDLSFGISPIRVLIASAHEKARSLLCSQIESEPGLEVSSVAADSDTAFDLVCSHQPDILLIDFALTSAYRARGAAAAGSDALPGLIVLIESVGLQNIVEAFERGAKGVVRLTALPSSWRSGIQSILAGLYWVEDDSIAILLKTARKFLGQTTSKTLPEFGLTLREIEIASKIAAGRSNKEVGLEFSICERTVKHHLTNIFRKVGVSSRLELAVLIRDAIENNPQALLSEEFQHD
jgi:DNA-binding NarL/FixJ family response regulator